MPNGAGATKWVGSIAVTAALIFISVAVATSDDSPDLVRGNTTGQQVMVTFSEGSTENWTVPNGVSSISVTAIGAGGFGERGGAGAVITATIPVVPGEALATRVALPASGGCTWIVGRTSPNDFKIIAGGGGGQGQSTAFAKGGRGGFAGAANGPAGPGESAWLG